MLLIYCNCLCWLLMATRCRKSYSYLEIHKILDENGVPQSPEMAAIIDGYAASYLWFVEAIANHKKVQHDI